jgi:hypothetical protein
MDAFFPTEADLRLNIEVSGDDPALESRSPMPDWSNGNEVLENHAH